MLLMMMPSSSAGDISGSIDEKLLEQLKEFAKKVSKNLPPFCYFLENSLEDMATNGMLRAWPN
jgi:hypothetical protein